MYSKIKLNSKNINQENNSIFKQINTNIITDYQRNKYLTELIQNQQNITFYQKNINNNENINFYINGTIDSENNNMLLQTQRQKIKSNKPISSNNSNINKKKQNLNRYNSYSRINSNNIKNNNTINVNGKKLTNKNRKMSNNNQRMNKIQNSNNSRGHYNMNLNNQRTPISSKKTNFIPLGNNKYKTIGENSNYSTFENKIYNDTNINRTFIQKNEHNTIDLNNLYSNKQSSISKKYNMKMPPTNIHYNINHNYNNNKPYNIKNNNYNHKNLDIHNNNKRKIGGSSRPKTPDFNKRKKSSKFLHNQRAKTPDRERNKMKLYLDKDYLNTINNRDNKRINHYNCKNRCYNHTIDNNNNKYKNSRLNTNNYFRENKKTINNYDYKDHSSINTNNNTLSSNKSNSRRYSYGKIDKLNNNKKEKKIKKLSKNASQGNILDHNNYNINLNSNGINHINKKVNENNHCYSNTNLVTPIKYASQRSNFKGNEIQMIQVRPLNNYNIYEETFQSFGRNIPTTINNNELNRKKYYNMNKNENNNDIQSYFKLKNYNKEENIKNIEKENIYYDYEKYKRLSLQNNNNNSKYELNYGIRETNGNYNNPYIPATLNNMENKTYSIFNYKKGKMKENINLNYNDNDQDYNETNKEIVIDFNDLDQFSPPYKVQFDLTNNNEKTKSNSKKFINIRNLQEGDDSIINYNMEFNNKKNYDYGDRYLKENNGENNRKVIDDFIKQLKTKF